MYKSLFLKILVAPVLFILASVSQAGEEASGADAVALDAGCSNACYSDCCCAQNSLIFTVESTFFRFHDSAGVEDGDGDDAEFDFDASPRVTLGYVGSNGRGARVRWWDYDHDTRSNDDDLVSVDTYNIDFEAFQVVNLPCRTTLDVSVGIRYNDFTHFYENGLLRLNEQHSFDGIGGMFALAGRVDLSCNLSAYARFREVIMMDDGNFDNMGGKTENDTTRPVTELGFGLQYRNCNWVVHGGFEWQNWGNYTSAGEKNLDGEAHDVGFAGFVVGAGLNY